MSRAFLLPEFSIAIEVDPWPYSLPTQQQRLKVCQEIKRHVDGILEPRIIATVGKVCEFCKSPWTESSPNYNGSCCDKDEEHNPNQSTEDIIVLDGNKE